jgi:hypothetical protein
LPKHANVDRLLERKRQHDGGSGASAYGRADRHLLEIDPIGAAGTGDHERESDRR